MTDSTPSPKRRHILSSINQDAPEADAKPTKSARIENDYDETHRDEKETSREASHGAERTSHSIQDDDGGGDSTKPRRSRLKLKSNKPRRRRSRSRHRDDDKYDRRDRHDRRDHHDDHGEHSQTSRSSRHHRRRRHRHRSPTPPNPFEAAPLDPEAAFRESLFDAMADDEGASYWESVYGQPIHVYSNEKVGQAGELEQMTDEEYAAYVRQKMWEKTHAGLLEERAKREEQRKQKKEEERKERKLHEEMEQSLRRGEERRQRKRWIEQWEEYTRAWAEWDGTPERLPWPVDGRQQKDINESDVRFFFVHGLDVKDAGEKSFAAKLKDERVRWHPDKVQQKLRGTVDGEIMKDVTAVFQIIDKLWTDLRPKE